MTDQWVTILAAVTGGLIAGAIGWFVSWRNGCRSFKHKTNMFTRSIKDDLNKSKSLYKKIVEEWEKSNTVWFDTLGEIESSREVYNKNKEWILVYPENIRGKISDYYYKSSIAIYYLRYLQNRKTQIGITVQTMILDLKTKNPNISPEQVDSQIINILGNPQRFEYIWLNETLPKKVNIFKELISNIDSLLPELDNIKCKM